MPQAVQIIRRFTAGKKIIVVDGDGLLLQLVGLADDDIQQALFAQVFLHGVILNRVKQDQTVQHAAGNEIFDGAMVNGTCVIASHKNTTWDHQNNRMIRELYSRHGKELNFCGCIISPIFPTLKDKYRCAHSTVNIARLLRLDGVVIPEEGGGNPESDLMMLIKGCETNGIKTVGIVLTHMGAEGLTTFTDEADAMITTGYLDEYVTLLPKEKTLGHPEQVALLSGGGPDSLKEDGSMYVSVVAIMGAHNELGSGKLASKVI